jgi:hypothetical protein
MKSFFQVLIISRLTYAISAFAGFLTYLHIMRFNVAFRESVKWGTDRKLDGETQISDDEVSLFRGFKDEIRSR